jgi:hypothetical protein
MNPINLNELEKAVSGLRAKMTVAEERMRDACGDVYRQSIAYPGKIEVVAQEIAAIECEARALAPDCCQKCGHVSPGRPA